MKETSERSDILAAGRCPLIVQRFLRQLGGLNPYGEPNIRIALADHILIQRGGEYHDWPKGTDLRDQGGLIFSEKTKIVHTTAPGPNGTKVKISAEMPEEMYVSQQKPTRVVKEMRWVKRYPDLKGWMLQHWDPPHNYGSREWWEAQKVGGTEINILGPFPERGDYEPFIVWVEFKGGKMRYEHQTVAEIPAFSRIEEGYNQWMRTREELLSACKEWRQLTRMIEFQRQQEAKEKKDDEEFQLRLRDRIAPVFSSSLEAGRIREEWAQRARAKGVQISHVGN